MNIFIRRYNKRQNEIWSWRQKSRKRQKFWKSFLKQQDHERLCATLQRIAILKSCLENKKRRKIWNIWMRKQNVIFVYLCKMWVKKVSTATMKTIHFNTNFVWNKNFLDKTFFLHFPLKSEIEKFKYVYHSWLSDFFKL